MYVWIMFFWLHFINPLLELGNVQSIWELIELSGFGIELSFDIKKNLMKFYERRIIFSTKNYFLFVSSGWRFTQTSWAIGKYGSDILDDTNGRIHWNFNTRFWFTKPSNVQSSSCLFLWRYFFFFLNS